MHWVAWPAWGSGQQGRGEDLVQTRAPSEALEAAQVGPAARGTFWGRAPHYAKVGLHTADQALLPVRRVTCHSLQHGLFKELNYS